MKTKYKYIAGIILLIVVFLFGWCSKPVEKESITTEPLKERVAELKHDQANAKDTVIYRDSIRDRWHTEWKEIRHDSLIPCPEKLLVADTVIRADSSLICSLRDVIHLDSLIILNQDSIIKIDSTTILGLKKEIRKQTRRKNFWKVIAGIATLANGVPR